MDSNIYVCWIYKSYRRAFFEITYFPRRLNSNLIWDIRGQCGRSALSEVSSLIGRSALRRWSPTTVEVAVVRVRRGRGRSLLLLMSSDRPYYHYYSWCQVIDPTTTITILRWCHVYACHNKRRCCIDKVNSQLIRPLPYSYSRSNLACKYSLPRINFVCSLVLLARTTVYPVWSVRMSSRVC